MDYLADCRASVNSSPPSDGLTFVFHVWMSVPVASHSLQYFYAWVVRQLQQAVTQWVFLLDPRESAFILGDFYAVPRSEVARVPSMVYDFHVCEWIVRFVSGQSLGPGTVVLVAQAGDFTPLFSLKALGWRIAVIHPPGVCRELQLLSDDYCFEMPVRHGPAECEDRNLTLLLADADFCFPLLDTLPLLPLDENALEDFLLCFGAKTIQPPAAKPPLPVLEDAIADIWFAKTTEKTLDGLFHESNNVKNRWNYKSYYYNQKNTNFYQTELSKMRKTVAVHPLSAPETSHSLPEGESKEEERNVKEKEQEKTGNKEEDTKKKLKMPEKKKKKMTDVCKMAAERPVPPKIHVQILPQIQRSTMRPPPVAEQPWTLVGGDSAASSQHPKSKPIKFAPQCPNTKKKCHDQAHCPFWHPRKVCEYYPKCYLEAEKCGYEHPFCREKEKCRCEQENRDPQKNHRGVGKEKRAT